MAKNVNLIINNLEEEQNLANSENEPISFTPKKELLDRLCRVRKPLHEFKDGSFHENKPDNSAAAPDRQNISCRLLETHAPLSEERGIDGTPVALAAARTSYRENERYSLHLEIPSYDSKMRTRAHNWLRETGINKYQQVSTETV